MCTQQGTLSSDFDPIPVRHLKFDSSTADAVGNDQIVTEGTLTYDDGVKGQAAFFDNPVPPTPETHVAPETYVIVPFSSVSNFIANISVAMFVKAADVDWFMTFASLTLSGRDPTMQFEFGGSQDAPYTEKIIVALGMPTRWTHLISDVSYVADTWYHVAVTINNKYCQLFVNGRLSDTKNVTSTTGTYDHFLLGSSGDFARGYKGPIDDFRVYDRTLSNKEVLKLAQGQVIDSMDQSQLRRAR